MIDRIRIPRVRRRVGNKLGADESDVGYGKPPKAHQFKPGQSGNPKGRKKGIRNEATILQDLLQYKVSITERGKTRKIPLMEAMLRKIAEDGLKGNVKSVTFLLNRYQTILIGDDSARQTLSEDDKVVLDAPPGRRHQCRPRRRRLQLPASPPLAGALVAPNSRPVHPPTSPSSRTEVRVLHERQNTNRSNNARNASLITLACLSCR
jgi:hypothetical protein